MILVALLGISPLPHAVEQAFLAAGRAQAAAGSPIAVAQNLALAANHLPWRTGLWEQAGHYALEGDDPASAVEYFAQAAAAGDLSPQGYLRFGDAYAALGNPYTALQLWSIALDLDVPPADALTRMADAYRQLDDPPSLIETLKTLLSLYSSPSPPPPSTSSPPSSTLDPLSPVPYPPSSIPGLNFEIGLHLAASDPASAPPYLLQAYELDPSLTEARELAFAIQRALPQEDPIFTLMAAGRKLAALEMWELGLRAFKRVVSLQPGYAEAWAYLGEALQHQEDPSLEVARTALEWALTLNPRSLPANIFMALYWSRNGDPDLAYQFLATASEIDPGNHDLLVDLGAAAAVAGDLQAAEEYYLEAIQLSFNDLEVLRHYVEFCISYNLDLVGVALPLARWILASDPADPAALDLMGQVLFRLGDLLNAQRFFLRSLGQDYNHAPAHLHLGLVYRLQGKSDLARDSFTTAISLAPGTPTADLAGRYLGTNPP